MSKTPAGRQLMFVVGVQKSGTTLVRSILNAHPRVLVAYDCAFYKRIHDAFADGAHLPADIDAIIDAAFQAPRFDLLDLPADAVRAHLRSVAAGPISYADLIGEIMDLFAERNKPEARLVSIKNPNGIFHLDMIRDCLGAPPVVNVIRDPRGVLASLKKRDVPRGTYRATDMIWQTRQRFGKMMRVHAGKADASDYHAVQYEVLLRDFEREVGRLLAFLELEHVADVLEYHRQSDAGKLIPEEQMFQHRLAIRPPDPSRIEAFREELDAHELAAMEMLAGPDMRALYPNRFSSTLAGLIAAAQVVVRKALSPSERTGPIVRPAGVATGQD